MKFFSGIVTLHEKKMKEINPAETTRARAFELWIDAPMPMVTLVTTLDVTAAVRMARQNSMKFNMLMCWCIGRAATRVKEFFMLPVGRRLMLYDRLAVCAIVKNAEGEVSSCDIPFSDDLDTFSRDYETLTAEVAGSCTDHDLSETHMVIGTSALIDCEIDAASGMYSGIYNNPFLIWGRYRAEGERFRLPVSFQFHHAQMDGAHAAKFLSSLPTEISSLTAD